MNRLLKHYQIDVEHPNVSGAEMLEMLHIRDRLAAEEAGLSKNERAILIAADRRLLQQATDFHAELCRFVNLAQKRQSEGIPPDRWWWHLDVLAELPAGAVISADRPVELA